MHSISNKPASQLRVKCERGEAESKRRSHSPIQTSAGFIRKAVHRISLVFVPLSNPETSFPGNSVLTVAQVCSPWGASLESTLQRYQWKPVDGVSMKSFTMNGAGQHALFRRIAVGERYHWCWDVEMMSVTRLRAVILKKVWLEKSKGRSLQWHLTRSRPDIWSFSKMRTWRRCSNNRHYYWNLPHPPVKHF